MNYNDVGLFTFFKQLVKVAQFANFVFCVIRADHDYSSRVNPISWLGTSAECAAAASHFFNATSTKISLFLGKEIIKIQVISLDQR